MSTQFQRHVTFNYCTHYTFLHCILMLHVRLHILLQLLTHLLSKFVSYTFAIQICVSWLVAQQGPVFMSSILSRIYQKRIKVLIISSYSNIDCMNKFQTFTCSVKRKNKNSPHVEAFSIRS